MLLVQWGEGKGEKREPVFRADLCVLHAAECNAVGFLTPAPAPAPAGPGKQVLTPPTQGSLLQGKLLAASLQ